MSKENLRDLARQLLISIEPHLSGAAKAAGVELTPARAVFDAERGTITVKAIFVARQPDAAFAEQAAKFGILPTDFGREFSFGPHQYRLVGFRLEEEKFKIAAVRLEDGKTVGLPEAAIEPFVQLAKSRGAAVVAEAEPEAKPEAETPPSPPVVTSEPVRIPAATAAEKPKREPKPEAKVPTKKGKQKGA